MLGGCAVGGLLARDGFEQGELGAGAGRLGPGEQLGEVQIEPLAELEWWEALEPELEQQGVVLIAEWACLVDVVVGHHAGIVWHRPTQRKLELGNR